MGFVGKSRSVMGCLRVTAGPCKVYHAMFQDYGSKTYYEMLRGRIEGSEREASS